MSLEDLLERAKKAHQEKKAKAEGPEVVSLPDDGRITGYGTVPPEEIRRAEEQHQASPDDPEAEVYLAFLHYAGKSYDQAVAHFQALLARGFKPENQHFYLGNCYYQMGRKAEARDEWQACLAGHPSESIERMVRRRLEWVKDA